MKITVDRFTSDNNAIISRVLVDGRFFCFAQEDEFQVDKLPTDTRISAGTYPIDLCTDGALNTHYQSLFPDMHKGILRVQDIPDLDDVDVHIGAKHEKNNGCLLVGDQAVTTPDEMQVIENDQAYQIFYQRVIDNAIAGKLSITYEDNDRPDIGLKSLMDTEFAEEAQLGTHESMVIQSILGTMEKYELAVWRCCLVLVLLMLMFAYL